MNTPRIAPLTAALLLAAACGGGSSDPATAFAVKGTVAGLAPGVGVTLQLGGPSGVLQNLTVSAGGPFQFTSRLPDGAAWTVTALPSSQVPRQTCLVAPASGTIAAADAAVTVTCTTDTFAVRGEVTGLALGSTVTLAGPGGDLAVTSGGDPTAFAFPTRVESGGAFQVTVALQPAGPSQTCQVAGGGPGTVAAADVVVAVTCEPNDKPVTGTLSGLTSPTGLVLRVNGGFDTTVTANGAFQVMTNLPSGTAWTLAVRTQPTNPWQTCTPRPGTPVSGTMGTTGASGVVLDCTTDAFPVGGSATAVLLPGLTLSLNDGPPLAVNGDGSFQFPDPVESGRPWLVKVVDLPATQACNVIGGSGTMAGLPVSGVGVYCGCAPDLGNCNLLPGDGCEAPLLTDADNCGSCFNACGFLNAGDHCSAGQCVMDACFPGWADCGGSPGCETRISTDPANCGGCGNACPPPPNATAGCSNGTCGLGTCSAGYGNCNGDAADGCETSLLATTDRCGACVAPHCAGGTCDAGFANCDGLAVNGCEAALATDPLHCGACGNSCDVYPNAAGVCTAGTSCSMGACDAGWDDCNGGAGCETQVAHDRFNCGACGLVCPSDNGTAGCLESACTMTACNAGFADCRGPAVAGCETSTTSDPLHCGSCGNACAPGQICGGSACVAPPSCKAILALAPSSLDGVYTIDPDGAGGSAAVEVFCDMTTDGGGWTFFAHVNGDYQAGRLFELDLGTYDPNRGDGNASYGLGGRVYQRIGATEIMVTLDVVDTLLARNSDRFVVYQFAPNALAFDTGPVPSLAPGALFKYRTHFDPLADGIINPDFFEDVWAPYTAEPDFILGGYRAVAPLTLLNGNGALGTFWGSGMAPPGTPGVDMSQYDSWWYAR